MSPTENDETKKTKKGNMPFVHIETKKDTMLADNPVTLTFNVTPRIAINMMQDAVQQIINGKVKSE